jgi:CheY-like chemotaxis protein
MAYYDEFSGTLSMKSSNFPDDDATDDAIHFIDEDSPAPVTQPAITPWKILIADDDVNVHESTVLALNGISIQGRGLDFSHAYSAKQAAQILTDHDDTDLLLLDVVMETPDAGLKLINTIRNDLKRDALKIVLRTGQPGSSDASFSIAKMAINGYATKSQLTRSLLISVLSDALPKS